MEKDSKICTKCGEDRSLDEYCNNKSSKDGKGSWCKICTRKYDKERIAKNRFKNLNTIKDTNDEVKFKYCSKCKENKLFDEFSTDNSKSDGKYGWCKSCVKEYDHKRNDEIKDLPEVKKKMKDKGARQYKKRKDTQEHKDYVAEYRSTHKDEIKEQKAAYYKANKTDIIKKNNEHRQERIKHDPEFAIRLSVSSQIRQALKSRGASKGGISCWTYLPYTPDELWKYLETLFDMPENQIDGKTYMCRENWKKYNPNTYDQYNTWNIDHIEHQANLPYTSMEDENFKKAWGLSNLRPYSSKLNELDRNNRTQEEITIIKDRIKLYLESLNK